MSLADRTRSGEASSSSLVSSDTASTRTASRSEGEDERRGIYRAAGSRTSRWRCDSAAPTSSTTRLTCPVSARQEPKANSTGPARSSPRRFGVPAHDAEPVPQRAIERLGFKAPIGAARQRDEPSRGRVLRRNHPEQPFHLGGFGDK